MGRALANKFTVQCTALPDPSLESAPCLMPNCTCLRLHFLINHEYKAPMHHLLATTTRLPLLQAEATGVRVELGMLSQQLEGVRKDKEALEAELKDYRNRAQVRTGAGGGRGGGGREQGAWIGAEGVMRNAGAQ